MACGHSKGLASFHAALAPSVAQPPGSPALGCAVLGSPGLGLGTASGGLTCFLVGTGVAPFPGKVRPGSWVPSKPWWGWAVFWGGRTSNAHVAGFPNMRGAQTALPGPTFSLDLGVLVGQVSHRLGCPLGVSEVL